MGMSTKQFNYITIRFTREQYGLLKEFCREVHDLAGNKEMSRFIEDIVVRELGRRLAAEVIHADPSLIPKELSEEVVA